MSLFVAFVCFIFVLVVVVLEFVVVVVSLRCFQENTLSLCRILALYTVFKFLESQSVIRAVSQTEGFLSLLLPPSFLSF